MHYRENPNGFNDVVWLYWGQSVLIGIFNFFDLLTVKNVEVGSLQINNTPVSNSPGSKGCSAFFFLFHYQFFHLGYFVFLAASYHKNLDFRFILIGLVAVAFNLLVDFIRHKIMEKTYSTNIGKMFFMPYLRIIPMHLMILVPAFLGWQASTIFLVLKTIADLVMYMIASPNRKTQSISPGSY